MGKLILTLRNIEIKKKKKKNCKKTPIFKKDVDIQKLLVSNRIYFVEKTCIMIIKLRHNASI